MSSRKIIGRVYTIPKTGSDAATSLSSPCGTVKESLELSVSRPKGKLNSVNIGLGGEKDGIFYQRFMRKSRIRLEW